MQDLRITPVQCDIIWENPESNRAYLDTLLATLKEPTDVVVLSEMFTTGFSMSPQTIAEPFADEGMATMEWMRSWSKKLNAVITGSVAVREHGKHYNRLIWMRPDGSYSTYDKRHTFTFAGEHEHYERGTERLFEKWRGWKICPLICYDLRFPVWSRNMLQQGAAAYDVLIYVANWPAVRSKVWSALLPARAIENQCYCLGVNRIGKDANGHDYSGNSALYDPKGDTLWTATPATTETTRCVLSMEELAAFRQKFPVLEDADRFKFENP